MSGGRESARGGERSAAVGRIANPAYGLGLVRQCARSGSSARPGGSWRRGAESGFFRVEKMRFPKKGQQDTILYNSQITISAIPAQAYQYVVNGKSAIEWVMERYQVTVHKESGIRNDPNEWAAEVGQPRYILNLLLSVINVSVQTAAIVAGLPEVKCE